MTIAAKKLGREAFYAHGRLCRKLTWLTEDHDGALDTLLNDDCQTPEQLALVEDLLNRLKVLTSKDLAAIAKNIATQICTAWKLLPENTIVAAMTKDSDPDGSQLALSFTRTALPGNWKGRLHNNTISAIENIGANEMLVILDDFVGTGNKACTYIEELQKNLLGNGKPNVTIKFVAIAGLEISKEEFDSRLPGIEYWFANLEKKGVSDHYPATEVETMLELMRSLEAPLRVSKKYKFGYEKSEAIWAIEGHSIPNNVFPIFWWDKYRDQRTRATLFQRR